MKKGELVSKMIKVGGIVAIGGMLASCGRVDAYTVLDQKCKNGDTHSVGGTDVAKANFLLEDGSFVDLGTAITVTGNKGGGFSVRSSNGVVMLPDGRTVVKIGSGILNPHLMVAMRSEKVGEKASVTFILNCKDQTTIPPIE